MELKKKFTEFIKKYKHAWVLLYLLIYLPWWTWLEKNVTTRYYVVQTEFDKYIPFIEYFIVPYLLWFLFIVAAFLYFFFYRCSRLLQTGGVYVQRDDDIPDCIDHFPERTGSETGCI